ncbi:MAG: phosphoglycolate phosphatase, partial [Burkholderiales bacterium]
VDTLPDLHEAGNRALADLGLAPVAVDQVRDYVGDGVDRLVKRILTGNADGEPEAELFTRARARFGEHYWQILSRASRPFPGVPKALDRMRSLGLRLACVTNKPGKFTLPLLESVGLLSRLDLIVSGDTLPRRKPDPLPLAHCAERFGVPQTRLLMIGDSRNDTTAARAAGCPVFCVAYGYRGGMDVRELDCDAIVATVSDSLELIRPVRS